MPRGGKRKPGQGKTLGRNPTLARPTYLTVTLEADALEALERLIARQGGSKAEHVRRALALYLGFAVWLERDSDYVLTRYGQPYATIEIGDAIAEFYKAREATMADKATVLYPIECKILRRKGRPMTNKITVLYPIEVPRGPYCWEYTKPGAAPCQFFENGIVEECKLGFGGMLTSDGTGYKKAFHCRNLQEASE